MEVFLVVVFLLALGYGGGEAGRYVAAQRREKKGGPYAHQRLKQRLWLSFLLMFEVALMALRLYVVVGDVSLGFFLVFILLTVGCLILIFRGVIADLRETRQEALELEVLLRTELLNSSRDA
jgi:cation transport ATPase